MSLAARRHGHRFRGRVYGLVGLLAVTVGGTIGSHLSYRRSVGANHNADAPDLAPADWTPVARLADLPDGQMTVRQAGIFPVLLLRRGDEVLAIANRCSHQSGPLHEGELVQAGDNGPCVICPWHGSTFRLRDGGVLHGPAVHPQPKLETQLDDEGRVLVRLAVEATAH
jgi:nitrite reductase/ring-hydroxylating ferredoxin subunit